jgi:hypothetical protein
VALLILALGISAATVMFTIVDGVLLRRLPFPAPDRLVALRTSTQDVGEVWGYSYPDIQDLIRTSRTLDVAAWTYGGCQRTSVRFLGFSPSRGAHSAPTRIGPAQYPSP